MANKKCELCNCELDEASFISHMSGKKHKRNHELDIARRNTIFVSGYGIRDRRQDLVNFFEQYGAIENIFFNNGGRSLKVVYKNVEPVKQLLSAPVYFSGKKLNIKTNTNTSASPVSDEDLTKTDASEKMHKDILNALTSTPNFDQQIPKLLECMQESEAELEKKKSELKQDLEQAFANEYKCKLYFFGSVAAGLGLKTSDIDIFVGFEDKPEISLEESQEYVGDVSSILQSITTKFDAVQKIICNTPIVKLNHVSTEVNCDITFKNRLGVYNSELLKYFLSIDPRVKSLIMIIKYWAKQHGFGGSKKITSYALAMMVVFYLQQLEDAVLPAVHHLQKNLKRMEAGCNAAFNDDRSILPKTKNTQKIPELLFGFFKYFAMFDYENKLISPFSGETHPKTIFEIPESLPDIFSSLKNSDLVNHSMAGVMVVQDPFELHRNITGCSQYILDTFKNFCILGADIFKNFSVDDSDLLRQIFEEIPESKIKTPNPMVVISIADHLKYLKNDSSKADGTHSIREQWYDKVHILIKMMFKDILNLELVEEGFDPIAESETEDDDLNLKEIKSYRYNGYADLIDDEKLTHFSKLKVLNIDNEIAYIKNMKANKIDKSDISAPLVDFHLIFRKMMNPTKVTLEFVLNMDDNLHYNNIIKFSENYLNAFIDQAIKKIKTALPIDLQVELNKVEKLTLCNEKDFKEQKSSNENRNKKRGRYRPDSNNEIGQFLFNNIDTPKIQQQPNKNGCYMFSQRPFFYRDDITPPGFNWGKGYEGKD